MEDFTLPSGETENTSGTFADLTKVVKGSISTKSNKRAPLPDTSHIEVPIVEYSSSKLLVPEEIYVMFVINIAKPKKVYEGRTSLDITFEFTEGEYIGERLICYYNVQLDKQGRVNVTGGSNLAKAIEVITGRKPKRKNRPCLRATFLNKYLYCSVITTTKNPKGKELDQKNWYSKVNEIKGVVQDWGKQ